MDVFVPQFQEQTDEVVGVMSQERVSGRVGEQTAEVPGSKAVSEEEVFVPQVMKENLEVTRWIPQESVQQCSGQEIVPGTRTSRRGVVSIENEVTGARLASSRHARNRQRKIASRLRVRFGDEAQCVVGMLESPGADLERPGMLEGLVVDLEYPLQSGSGWRGMENDSKENVLEWTVDDFDEKVIDEVVEAKRFKQVSA